MTAQDAHSLSASLTDHERVAAANTRLHILTGEKTRTEAWMQQHMTSALLGLLTGVRATGH